MTDRDAIRATAQARTRDLLLALWRAAPDGVRSEVEAIGKAHKSGELAPMGVTDRLGPLLRERWSAGSWYRCRPLYSPHDADGRRHRVLRYRPY